MSLDVTSTEASVILELRPYTASTEASSWSMVESSCMTMVFVAEVEKLYRRLTSAFSRMRLQAPPLMVRSPMSRFFQTSVSVWVVVPEIDTSPASMFSNTPKWMRCIVMSPDSTFIMTASSPTGPTVEEPHPLGVIHRSALPKSTSSMYTLDTALKPLFA